MAKGLRLKGKWFWLVCAGCGWRGQSNKMLSRCPRCDGHKTLKREAQLEVSGELSFEVSEE